MRIVVDAVAKGRSALPETSTAYETGAASLVVAETEQRPTVLGLVASGPAVGATAGRSAVASRSSTHRSCRSPSRTSPSPASSPRS